MGVGSMSGLYIGVSGLGVNQTALNTTAHNLSNLDTGGYTRQQVLMKDTTYSTYQYGAVYSEQTGLGTSMSKIRQVRDTFTDAAYRTESGRGSFYSSMYDVAEEVQKYFGADVDDEKLKNAMNTFWSSMNELQKTPDSIVNRETVIQSAQEMVEQAKLVYDQIKDYQQNVNEQIESTVSDINDLAERLHDINTQIVKVESGHVESANDLRDERNKLLDTLASYGEISYRENSAGAVTVLFEGTSLVTEDRAFKLGTQKISGDSSLLDVVWASHGNMPVYNFKNLPSAAASTDVGSLKGLLFARGSRIGNYTLMDESSLDWQSVKNDDGTQKYNSLEDFYKGEGYSGYSDYYSREIEPFLVTNIETELDYLMHNVVTTVNDILCPNTTAGAMDSSLVGQTLTGSDGDITVSADTVVLDTDHAPIALGDDGEPGTELFSRKVTPRYKKYNYTDSNGKTKTLYVYNREDVSDPFTQYTIDQIEVNPVVIKNPSELPLSNTDHSNDQNTLNKLLDAWSSEGDFSAGRDSDNLKTLTPSTLTGFNLTDYYDAVVADLANRGNSYNNISQNQDVVANQLDTKRQIVEGTSSNDELSNMIMFQQGYNASSRYINVVADMLDTLINRLGNA